MSAERVPTLTIPMPSREHPRAKAARLLLEGRVRLRLVEAGRCWAVVNGDTATYKTGCARSRWFCSCDHVGARCSHILAVRAIVDLSTHHNDQETNP
jgi:hypothetical protein